MSTSGASGTGYDAGVSAEDDQVDRPPTEAELAYQRQRVADLEYGVAEAKRVADGARETGVLHAMDLKAARSLLKSMEARA